MLFNGKIVEEFWGENHLIQEHVFILGYQDEPFNFCGVNLNKLKRLHVSKSRYAVEVEKKRSF